MLLSVLVHNFHVHKSSETQQRLSRDEKCLSDGHWIWFRKVFWVFPCLRNVINLQFSAVKSQTQFGFKCTIKWVTFVYLPSPLDSFSLSVRSPRSLSQTISDRSSWSPIHDGENAQAAGHQNIVALHHAEPDQRDELPAPLVRTKQTLMDTLICRHSVLHSLYLFLFFFRVSWSHRHKRIIRFTDPSYIVSDIDFIKLFLKPC